MIHAIKSMPGTRRDTARKLALQGTENTRQLGGLPIVSGAVRRDWIWRSDALSRLTEQDVATLQRLEIQTVIDLRTPREIRWQGVDRFTSPKRVSLPMEHDGDEPNAALYLDMMQKDRPAMQGFFKVLADRRNYPILYHCSAGKDRSGILTALLLDALGTPRAAIMDDYLQSRPQRVEPAWLQAVFDCVDEQGGVKAYLEGLGVDVSALRENLANT